MDMIVVLVGVNRGVMDANIRHASHQEQMLRLQAAQQNFQICPEECAVASFVHRVLPFDGSRRLIIGRLRITLHTVDVLRPVQLPAEIHQILAVDLPDMDNGHVAAAAEILRHPLHIFQISQPPLR
ncbi:hypothetical protein D3C75_834910 [compost metagenome]